MEFNRMTVTAAAKVVSEFMSHADMEVLEVQWEIHGECRDSSKAARAADWAKLALSTDRKVLTENGEVSLARAIVESAIKAPPAHRDSDTWRKLLAGLRFDGFEVEIKSDEETWPSPSGEAILKRMLPAEIPETDFREAEDEVTSLLEEFGFSTTLGHLKQALSAYQRGEWSSANAQMRNVLESCLLEIARALGFKGETFGKEARDYLSTINPPFLLVEYNEWHKNNRKPQYVQGLFSRLHPHGGHPGLSEEEDATFRLQIVLVTIRLFLRRFDKRKSGNA